MKYITQKQFDKITDKNTNAINEYEIVREGKVEKYVKKEDYFGDPTDIVKNNRCDLNFLNGATIKKIGFHREASEGGLAIVFEKGGKEEIVVLGFTELGMWVEARVELP